MPLLVPLEFRVCYLKQFRPTHRHDDWRKGEWYISIERYPEPKSGWRYAIAPHGYAQAATQEEALALAIEDLLAREAARLAPRKRSTINLEDLGL